ncbi:hypothetical protein PVAND_007042 [Polypedilum vanderplanki]|uniref:DUF4795 domain-containing protein n=1 Tax=Polypedilum vanderplanki TaxID=319348 RepID=A0A9J6C5L2_POLVA|nr:hypothetical protein PVAND_007042 [Polypedilum vanderplanki]
MEIINDVRKSSSIEITTSKNNVSKENEIVDPINEINWLKERMLDISESLKLHSECLRKFKCDELPKIKSSQEELCNSLQTLKYQVIRRLESEKAAKIKESKFEIESLKQQMISVSSQIREVEKNLETCKQSTSNEMLTLRNEFVDKIKDQMSVTSEIIKIENLECPSSKNNLKKDFEMDNDDLQVNSYTCMCPNVTSSIFDIKKQVSSQSICMQQLVRDLSMKLDRCEFQVYCHEINDTIECLMQLKNDICSTPMAAGASIPLLRNVNCISCQTTANMKITESTVPKLRPIKGSQDQDNSTCISCCNKTISDANWSCYTQKSGRARAMSRLKCRKTPFRSCGSPILIYKNRFRKHCC